MSRSPSRDRSTSRAGRTLAAAAGGGGGGVEAIDPGTLIGTLTQVRGKDTGANGTTVSTWTDASVSANNATPGAGSPTVATASTPNGGKSVRYAGAAFHQWPYLWQEFGAVKVSSTYDNDVTYNCSNLLDGSTSTHWASFNGGGLPQWVRLQLASAAAVTEYTITPSGANYPTAWTFAGSNDGTTWTTLDTRSSITLSGTTAASYSFANSTAYLYYRLNVTASTTSIVMLSGFTLTGQTLTALRAMEIWAVLKADSGSAGSLWSARPGGDAAQVYSGTSITETWGIAGSRTFTPTVSLNTWRLYHVYNDGTTWGAEIDGVSQDTASAQTVTFVGLPRIGANGAAFWSGNAAEVVIRNRVATVGEKPGIHAYFNTEHGLTIT